MIDNVPNIRIAVIVNGKEETSRPAMFEETIGFSTNKADNNCTIVSRAHDRSER